MKSSKVEIKSKLAVWSGIALMALSLSTGRPVLAAEDIKLWHIASEPADSKLLLQFDDKIADSAKSQSAAVEMILGADKKPADMESFVKSYQNEPIQFMQAMQASWAKASKEITDDKSLSEEARTAKQTDFVKSINDKLLAIDADKFGGKHRKDAIMEMTLAMFSKKVDDKDLIKNLFSSPVLRLALEVTNQSPKKDAKVDEKKKDEPVVKKDDGTTAPPVASTEKPPVVTPPPTVIPPSTGEQGNDALDRARAQQICDAIKGRDQQRDQELQKLFDTANQVLDRKAGESTINPALLANQKKEKDLSDILTPLINGLAQEKKDDTITPAPTNTQPFVPNNNRREDRNQDANAFNAPLPQPEVPQQPPPFFLPPNTSTGVQTQVRLDLPASSGRQELRDAQEVSSLNEMRTPIAASLSPMATMSDLTGAKVKVRTDMQKTQIALSNAKDRASRLDEQLEELKEGGRAALSPEVKRQQAQLQGDVDTSRRNYDQQRQMIMMIQDPEQRQQLQSMLMTLQQDLNFKEQKLSQFNAQVDVAVEDGNRQIKGLAKVRDQLNSEVTKLTSQLAGMKEDEQAVTTLINQNLQLQMAQMQPQRGGVQNVNNGTTLQQFGGNTGLPRTYSPSRLGTALGTQSGQLPGSERGQLGK